MLKFNPEFVPKILSRTKYTTFRGKHKDNFKVNQTIKLICKNIVSGQDFSYQFASAQIVQIHNVSMIDNSLYFGLWKVPTRMLDKIAIADGFNSYSEMVSYFNSNFFGVRIVWDVDTLQILENYKEQI